MALDFGIIKNPNPIVSSVPREFTGATLINASNTASNNENTVYEVPAGKKLWLVSLVLDTNFAAGTAANAAYAQIDGGYCIRLYGAAAAGTKMQTLGTNQLIEIKAGVKIEIETLSANVFASVAITGYLVEAGT